MEVIWEKEATFSSTRNFDRKLDDPRSKRKRENTDYTETEMAKIKKFKQCIEDTAILRAFRQVQMKLNHRLIFKRNIGKEDDIGDERQFKKAKKSDHIDMWKVKRKKLTCMNYFELRQEGEINYDQEAVEIVSKLTKKLKIHSEEEAYKFVDYNKIHLKRLYCIKFKQFFETIAGKYYEKNWRKNSQKRKEEDKLSSYNNEYQCIKMNNVTVVQFMIVERDVEVNQEQEMNSEDIANQENVGIVGVEPIEGGVVSEHNPDEDTEDYGHQNDIENDYRGLEAQIDNDESEETGTVPNSDKENDEETTYPEKDAANANEDNCGEEEEYDNKNEENDSVEDDTEVGPMPSRSNDHKNEGAAIETYSKKDDAVESDENKNEIDDDIHITSETNSSDDDANDENTEENESKVEVGTDKNGESDTVETNSNTDEMEINEGIESKDSIETDYDESKETNSYEDVDDKEENEGEDETDIVDRNSNRDEAEVEIYEDSRNYRIGDTSRGGTVEINSNRDNTEKEKRNPTLVGINDDISEETGTDETSSSEDVAEVDNIEENGNKDDENKDTDIVETNSCMNSSEVEIKVEESKDSMVEEIGDEKREESPKIEKKSNDTEKEVYEQNKSRYSMGVEVNDDTSKETDADETNSNEDYVERDDTEENEGKSERGADINEGTDTVKTILFTNEAETESNGEIKNEFSMKDERDDDKKEETHTDKTNPNTDNGKVESIDENINGDKINVDENEGIDTLETNSNTGDEEMESNEEGSKDSVVDKISDEKIDESDKIETNPIRDNRVESYEQKESGHSIEIEKNYNKSEATDSDDMNSNKEYAEIQNIEENKAKSEETDTVETNSFGDNAEVGSDRQNEDKYLMEENIGNDERKEINTNEMIINKNEVEEKSNDLTKFKRDNDINKKIETEIENINPKSIRMGHYNVEENSIVITNTDEAEMEMNVKIQSVLSLKIGMSKDKCNETLTIGINSEKENGSKKNETKSEDMVADESLTNVASQMILINTREVSMMEKEMNMSNESKSEERLGTNLRREATIESKSRPKTGVEITDENIHNVEKRCLTTVTESEQNTSKEIRKQVIVIDDDDETVVNVVNQPVAPETAIVSVSDEDEFVTTPENKQKYSGDKHIKVKIDDLDAENIQRNEEIAIKIESEDDPEVILVTKLDEVIVIDDDDEAGEENPGDVQENVREIDEAYESDRLLPNAQESVVVSDDDEPEITAEYNQEFSDEYNAFYDDLVRRGAVAVPSMMEMNMDLRALAHTYDMVVKYKLTSWPNDFHEGVIEIDSDDDDA